MLDVADDDWHSLCRSRLVSKAVTYTVSVQKQFISLDGFLWNCQIGVNLGYILSHGKPNGLDVADFRR